MADISVLVAKITFVVVEIIFKEDVITFSVAKIIYIVVVAVVTSSVAKITLVVNETIKLITFSVVNHLFSGK